ncbi:MAG TPA: NRDE family protein [Acetobacteraceae bacterium]
MRDMSRCLNFGSIPISETASMCTLVMLRRPDHPWPVLIAANRDEMGDRPWRAPGRHWPDRPDIVAGYDELAGGSWFGVNESGLVAGVLNREGTLGPQADKRSRGELVLDALDHADAVEAAGALSHLDPRAWRPFNLVVADNRDAFVLIHAGGSARIRIEPLPEGLSLVTARDPNDRTDPRIARFRPLFAAAPLPDPERDDWRGWQALLASPEHDRAAGPKGAMAFETPGGFGTRSGTLLALPAVDRPGVPPRLLFAAGRPGTVPWEAVPLE